MVSKLRARTSDDKNARREQLLSAALELWNETTFSSFTMLDVAARAGLAKGTTYLYFKTKEELLLALLTQELEDWFHALNNTLQPGTDWNAKRAARTISASFQERLVLTQLITIQASILEHNISSDRALEFKQFLLQHAAQTSALLEQRLSFLRPGEGIWVLQTLNALVIGLGQLSDPSAVVHDVLERPELQALQVHFDTHLRNALEAVLTGMESKQKKA
jgi:AcrR family transcriptional regulator